LTVANGHAPGVSPEDVTVTIDDGQRGNGPRGDLPNTSAVAFITVRRVDGYGIDVA
jgi:hypothetical protein